MVKTVLSLNPRRSIPLALLLVIVSYVAVRIFAAGPAATFLPANGTVTSGATVTNSSNAIGGKMIVFGPTATPSPAPTPTPTPASVCLSGTHAAGASDGSGGCWPGPNNTGVPSSTTLSNYSGPCTITAANTTISAKTVNCDLDVQAAGLTIKNSKVNGRVELRSDLSGSTAWSFSIQDSEVDGGTPQLPAVSGINLSILRSNIHGGAASVHCDELSSSTCAITDSWLHGQYMPNGANWHLSAFSLKGGYNVTLTHNTLACDITNWNNDGGCTADVDLIPNFAPVSHVTVDHNLLVASMGNSYCAYGGEGASLPYPHADHTIFENNVFQHGTNSKCGAYGPITDFNTSGTGNLWANNTWDNGGAVAPAN